MTEELWEATYLDRMELIAVDHPAEVDIFSNEKVGPPEIAEFKIHTVRDRRLPLPRAISTAATYSTRLLMQTAPS